MVTVYEVGGAVRDKMLGLKPKDIDYAVETSSYEEMKDYILSKGTIYLEVPQFFTIRGKLDGVDADFVLCRKESSYSDGRRPDKVEVGDIYDDLSRRDFTVNAMAMNKETGITIDPYNGLKDLVLKDLRCVGNTEERFREDALRMLRAIRFKVTKGFSLSDEINDCFYNSELIDLLTKNISHERIKDELNKCFVYDTATTFVVMSAYRTLFDAVFSIPGIYLQMHHTTKNKGGAAKLESGSGL